MWDFNDTTCVNKVYLTRGGSNKQQHCTVLIQYSAILDWLFSYQPYFLTNTVFRYFWAHDVCLIIFSFAHLFL